MLKQKAAELLLGSWRPSISHESRLQSWTDERWNIFKNLKEVELSLIQPLWTIMIWITVNLHTTWCSNLAIGSHCAVFSQQWGDSASVKICLTVSQKKLQLRLTIRNGGKASWGRRDLHRLTSLSDGHRGKALEPEKSEDLRVTSHSICAAISWTASHPAGCLGGTAVGFQWHCNDWN